MTQATPAAGDPLYPPGLWSDLLDYLDPARTGNQSADRDAVAEARYLEILRKLVCFFAGRGCRDAEDLAVECVLRVAGKCTSLDASARENRIAYFYGVARNVLHESWRESQRESAKRDSLRREFVRLGLPDPSAWGRKEAVHGCLDRCMEALTERSRSLVLSYYGEEGAAKVERHRQLAADLGKSVNALRIEVHRIRATLRQCVGGCLQPGATPGRPGNG